MDPKVLQGFVREVVDWLVVPVVMQVLLLQDLTVVVILLQALMVSDLGAALPPSDPHQLARALIRLRWRLFTSQRLLAHMLSTLRLTTGVATSSWPYKWTQTIQNSMFFVCVILVDHNQHVRTSLDERPTNYLSARARFANKKNPRAM